MQGLRASLVVFGLLGVCVAAQADLAQPLSARTWVGDPASARSLTAPTSGTSAACAHNAHAREAWTGIDVVSARTPELPQPGLEAGDNVRVLPPAPSSILLSLTAFGSLAVWQLGRSARHARLGHVPEWFHTGAPARIGRATILELNVGPQPAACFEPPGGGDPPSCRTFGLAEVVIPISPRILSPEQPRGPPPLPF
ncbi:MAG: hypothetical protein ACYS5V_07510 [Planctomycetota bacterium]|jgi:hypothetical protein